MKKRLALLFVVAGILSLALGAAQTLYGASGTGQENNNKVIFSEWGASFKLPSYNAIILVHALSAQKGMRAVMDIPSELYPQVKNEFNAASKSLQFK